MEKMMYPAKFIGPGEVILAGSFACNGTSTPTDVSYQLGCPFTVAYAATGKFTVTFGSNLALPNQAYSVIVTPQFNTSITLATDYFDVAVWGATTLNTSTPAFVIQAHTAGTAVAPAAAAGTRINFLIYASNSTGK